MNIKEKDLHLIWKYALFNTKQLNCTLNFPINILHRGYYNESDAGPDFTQAKIRYKQMQWIGNIEIHVYASDWFKHQHQNNKSYQSVILHVVWENDLKTTNECLNFPCLELKNYVSQTSLNKLNNIVQSKETLVCKPDLQLINSLDWCKWKEDLLIERFTEKTENVLQIFSTCKSWEETAYRLLLKSLGAKVNQFPMSLLGKYLPYKLLQKEKHRNSYPATLLLGTAGMLDGNFKDAYLLQLQEQFSFLTQKYRISPMELHWWKWLRMRPSNFPNIQLAILAENIYHWKNLVSVFEQSLNWQQMKYLFKYPAASYWDNHYKNEVVAKNTLAKVLGNEQLKRIYINAIIPFNLAYKKNNGMDVDFLNLLENCFEIPAEKNKITKIFEAQHIENKNTWDSQALIQLYNFYCSKKKCLNCNVGIKILKNNQDD